MSRSVLTKIEVQTYVCVCVRACTHAAAETWDEAECSSHANEGLGKYSDGWEQGAVKASLVLILRSAAGFTQHSGNSVRLLWLWHVNTEVTRGTDKNTLDCFGNTNKSPSGPLTRGVFTIWWLLQRLNMLRTAFTVLYQCFLKPHETTDNSHITDNPFRTLFILEGINN